MTDIHATWASWKRDARCDCTDPDPAVCTAGCEPSPRYTRECPCHYLTNRKPAPTPALMQCPTCGPHAPACLFCAVTDPAANRIMLANATCYARYDNYPAAPGHVEIVPRRHVESFFDLTPAEAADAHALLHAARQIIDAEHHPDGYTIGINDGQAAGRTVDHVHIHLIPRHDGDVDDPRGGIRRGLPNWDPDRWGSPPAPDGLRERLDDALRPWLYEDTVDRAMTVIGPELARRDAELQRLRAETATVERVRAECDRIEAAVRANPTHPDFDGAYLAAIGHVRAALNPKDSS